jgi:hypothetical protein
MITPTAVLLILSGTTVPAETTDPDVQKILIDNAGPIAMAFVVALGIAMFFLFRSMSRQIKKIDPTLPAGPQDTAEALDRERIAEAMERGRTTGPGGAPGPDADDASGS